MALKPVLDSLDGLAPEVAAEYVERDGKFHIQVEGMKPEAEFNRLQQSLTSERNAHSGLKTKITSVFGDAKFEDIAAKLDKLPELEAAAAGKLDEAQIEGIVEGRIKTRVAPLERENGNLKNENAQLKASLEAFEGKERTRTIQDHIRAAAKSSGVLDTAIEDALLLGERVFELTDDGKAVVKDGSGFAPGLQPKDWLADLQTKRPHWWGESVGGGAGGNRGNGGNTEPNPFTAENWNMTKQGELVVKDRSRAEALAKAAGTTIGGPKPAAKK